MKQQPPPGRCLSVTMKITAPKANNVDVPRLSLVISLEVAPLLLLNYNLGLK